MCIRDSDKFAEIRQLPLHIIVLTDGPSKLWFDYIKSHIEWPEIVQVYDLLSIEASEVVKQDICPGTLVILAPTQQKGELQECRAEARRFLHEADKILQYTFKLGGATVLLTTSASPVMRTAKLAKLTLDLRWQEVYRRYDAKHPHDRGELYIMSDSQAILKSLYGLSDPSVVQTEGI